MQVSQKPPGSTVGSGKGLARGIDAVGRVVETTLLSGKYNRDLAEFVQESLKALQALRTADNEKFKADYIKKRFDEARGTDIKMAYEKKELHGIKYEVFAAMDTLKQLGIKKKSDDGVKLLGAFEELEKEFDARDKTVSHVRIMQ